MQYILKNKPNFFIVGMPRSGTTSLYLYLKQHPQVFLSILKEPHYFGSDLPLLDSYVKDYDGYMSLFEGVGNEQVIGEASVWYLESKTAIEELFQFNPDSRLIVVLRNPIEMTQSLHSLYLRTGNEDVTDFYEAFNLEESRKKGNAIPEGCYYKEGLCYRTVGLYCEKLRKVFDAFGRKQVEVVLFDDLVNRPDETYHRLLTFLDLERFTPEFDRQKAEIAVQTKVLKQLKSTSVDIKMKIRQKRVYLHEKKASSTLSGGCRLALLDFFKEDITATSKLINRSLDNWLQ